MECQASWIPNAVATLLRSDRTAQPIISWLTVIRDSTEEYDPLVTVRPTTPEPAEDSESPSPDSAFDEILSQLGQEIFKLDEYQKYLTPEEKEVSLSILNIFDECLHEFPSKFEEKHCFELTPEETVEDLKVYNGAVEVCKIDGELIECIDIEKVQCEEVFEDSLESEVVDLKDSQVCENGVANSNECNCDTSSSDLSFVSSTPAKCDKASDINKIFYQGEGTPIPPRRARLKTPSSTSSYDNMEFTDAITAAKRLDSDSESTCWRYQECNADAEDSQTPYGVVWSHSSGFHNSDEIIRRVLLQNHATISRVSYDTASEFEPARFSVYALQEEGDRCSEPVAIMTPDKPTDDGYEPVRDAITTDNDNIYEEIDFNNSYTDEGFSCGGSVEVESCSISASSEGVGRDSPLYINLRDHGAYEVSRDVIYWKNLLLDPFYNEDEEDEWISPEESVEYAREARPPLVIPRITQYRAPRRDPRPQIPAYNENYDKVLKSQSKYGRIQDWSPTYERSRLDLERGYAQAAESPPLQRIHKRLGASTENLLVASRRPNHLPLPASSSDSLDVEVRPDRDIHVRGRKSRSMVTTKRQIKSPIPTPRQPPPPTAEVPVVYEGPVKRTKFFEGGKKSKKNWVDCYMVLTPTALYFYKDQKTFHGIQRQPGTPSSPSCPRMEVALPLLNAHVVPCLPSHTRRYLKSLELTVSYDRYLLQDESEEGARIWLKEIQKIIYDLGPLNPHENLHSPLQSSRSDLESLGRTPPASRHSNRSKQKAGGSSNEDESDSTEVSKSHVKSRLRKFFAKRPSMEVLVKKGIYKDEPVFGRNLAEVCPTSGLRVPPFVVSCIREIESNEENMCTDGLYRASGNLSQVQKIRLEIDQNNQSSFENNTDIHVLTGSLKLFFRELKEPLIPCNMFDRILAACSIKPREAKVKEFRSIVQALPECNRDTLKYLLEHLLRVTEYKDRNRMHTANLAIVFGPTLLWAPAEQAHNIAIDCIQQNNVVDTLLTEFNEIFAEDTKARRKS